MYIGLYRNNNILDFMKITAVQLKKLRLTQRRKAVGVSQQEMTRDLEIDAGGVKELELEDAAMQKLLNKINEDKNGNL